MKESVSMGVKDGIRNSIILPTVLYASEIDMKCSTPITNTLAGNGAV